MAGSAFAGIVVDRSDNVAAYYGEGAGLAAGSGASLAVQAGFSNGTGTHSISGPFADVGAGGGAGAAGGADYFGGWTDGQLVQGGSASVGVGLGGSASAQTTFTNIVGPSCR
jgi:hypothetical protein